MNKAKFDINPHVIRQLGAELVSDQVTALLELIKNSYDADAQWVKIEINTEENCDVPDLFNPDHKGFILVEDDGFGMDRETLIKSWLTISYSKKRVNGEIKPKTPLGRTPLGDKGLGRLSTQRLANCCEIYTKEENSSAYHVGFKWSDFDKVDRLGEVKVNFEPTRFDRKSGTKMYLLDLIDKNSWKGDSLERLKGAMCQIIAPYEKLKPFKIYFSIDGELIDIAEEIGKLEQLNVCDVNFEYKAGKVNGTIDVHLRKLVGNNYADYKNLILSDNGREFTKYLLEDKKNRGKNFYRSSGRKYWLRSQFSFDLKSLLSQRGLSNDDLVDPGNFSGRIQEFYLGSQDKEISWWSNLYKSFNEYKNFVQSQVGIKIYRNGFAVRPYGIDGNDWLGLGRGQTGGSSYYGLRPGNVIGYVAIDEGINSSLKDKTDREGLIENSAYRNFYKLMTTVIDRYSEQMENLRRCYADFRSSVPKSNKIRTTRQALEVIKEQIEKKQEVSEKYRIVDSSLVSIGDKVGKVAREVAEKSSIDSSMRISYRETIEELQELLGEAKKVLSQALNILNESNNLKETLTVLEPKLRALEAQLAEFSELASLGLISEMVTHDLNQISGRLFVKGRELEKRLDLNLQVPKDDLYALVDFINSTVSSLRAQMKHLDPSLKYHRERRDVFSVKKMLKEEEIPYYESKIYKKKIKFILKVEEDFPVKMNKGKLMQVFDNLINNSIYWLDRRFESSSSEPEAIIKIRVKKPWVYFEDNGEGIDQSVENVLFEPFVTRKPRGEGRGMGLFIVRQLLDSYKCDIYLDEAVNEKGNKYRFSINLNEVVVNNVYE